MMMGEIRLSPKQQAFVQALIKGATYADAYKKAGFPGGQSRSVATSNASNILRTNPNVRQAMKIARDELRERNMLEACDIIEMLRETREVAQAADPPQASAAVAAAMGIAKLLGLQIDRSEAVIMHKPAPLPTTLVELSTADWQRQFDPTMKTIDSQEPRPDFLD
jgi:hypothetical protein